MTTSSSASSAKTCLFSFEVPLILGHACFSSGPLRVISPSSHTSRGEERGQKVRRVPCLCPPGTRSPFGIVLALRSGRRGFRVCVRAPRSAGTRARRFGLGLVEALPYDLLGRKSLPAPRSGRHLAAEACVPQPMCALYVHAESPVFPGLDSLQEH